jgi:hypothetical protein
MPAKLRRLSHDEDTPMRFVPFAAALGLIALPALAQTNPPPNAAAPAAKPASTAAPPAHHRMTMEEQFTTPATLTKG